MRPADGTMVGEFTSPYPTSPRIYQFEPISTSGLLAGSPSGGGAVPNRSAACVGVDAIARLARATAAIFFIDSIPIAALRRNRRTARGQLRREILIWI